MSYILDALRKAEAERERGRVPGVHAQPAFGGVAPGLPAGDRRLARWTVPLLAAIAVLVAVLVWLLLRREPVPVATTSAPAPAPVVMPTPTTAPGPEPAPVAVSKAPAIEVAPPPAARRARTPSPAVTTPTPTPAVATTPKPVATDNADARVYAIADLPDDIRRQLPGLAVGGSVYSSVPANRILFLNGQVVHEGDRVSPELVLQQIRLKTAVMAFRGYRYELPF